MSIPFTKIEVDDQSQIRQPERPKVYRPLFMGAFSSDKGPEGLQVIDEEMSKVFGEISFARHGQALLQADAIVKAGGKFLGMRLVPENAKLANVIIVAKVKTEKIQKTNDQGQLLYLKDGAEVTDATDAEAIMIDAAIIKYEAKSIENVKTIKEVDVNAETLFSETVDSDGFKTYPLFTFTDVGRGVSNKKIKISPNYESSKNTNFVKYLLEVLESNIRIEAMQFSIDPNKVYFDKSYSLETVVKASSSQVQSSIYENVLTAFVNEVAKIIKPTFGSLLAEDLLFGYRRTFNKIKTIKIHEDSINLSSPFGIALENGDNGEFGVAPVKATEYEDMLESFFKGELTDDIYDYMKYPVEAIVDANYSAKVKRAAESYAVYKDDLVYMGDLGFVHNVEQMKNVLYPMTKNRNIYATPLSYNIRDPYTRKEITVTGTYSIAKLLVSHLKERRNKPFSGLLHKVILEDAIEGTVNFIPKMTPKINQKQILDDMRLAYATYIDGKLVLETQYTLQNEHTELSYLNNVLATQELIRAIRAKCPRNRYSFIDGKDLEQYKSDVEDVIEKYAGNFKTIKFEYIQDETMVQNKIFYAAIKISFRPYVQGEYFKIIPINSTEDGEK